MRRTRSAPPGGTETPGAEDEAPAEERFSPLIINSISPDPIPVTGTDQREHLVYELEVQNASPRPATVTKVETMDGDAVIATLEGPQITALSMIVGDYALPPIPADVIPPGRSVLMIMQAVFDEGASVPSALEHRFTATFGEFEPNQGDFAVNNFPDEITETAGIVTVGEGEPELLGPPLTGGDGWP